MQSCKVIIVGDASVGKRSFCHTYTSNTFPDIPTVFDDYTKTIRVESKTVALSLWNAASYMHEDVYDRLRPLRYPYTDAYILAYSVANLESFNNVAQKWVPEILRYWPAPMVLVGTKADLREDPIVKQSLEASGTVFVTTKQGQELAAQIGALGFFEVSAKTITGIEQTMDHVIRAGIGLVVGEHEPLLPPKPDPPVFTAGADVCDELELLVNEKIFHDVVFRVKDESIYCHKFVLCSACPSLNKLITQHESIGNYFTSSIMSDNNNNNVCVVSVSEVSHVELLEFIKFVYNGKVKQSPTNEFIQLAKACDIDYTVNRRAQMKKSIAANVKTMHDIEIISKDKKRFPAIKALLWCRSKYFQEQLTDSKMKEMRVDAHSTFVDRFLDFVAEGVIPHDVNEYILNDDLMQWSARWSTSMSQAVQLFLVESVINLKNVFEWTNITRARYPELYEYCKWLMRVNYSSISLLVNLTRINILQHIIRLDQRIRGCETFSSMTALQELEFYRYAEKPFANNMTNLTKLKAPLYKHLEDRHCFTKLTNLSELYIEKQQQVHLHDAIDGLDQLTQLTHFSVAYQTSDNDWRLITKLTNLMEYSEYEYIGQNISRFADLTVMQHLTYLDVDINTGNLDDLMRLTRLQRFESSDAYLQGVNMLKVKKALLLVDDGY